MSQTTNESVPVYPAITLSRNFLSNLPKLHNRRKTTYLTPYALSSLKVECAEIDLDNGMPNVGGFKVLEPKPIEKMGAIAERSGLIDIDLVFRVGELGPGRIYSAFSSRYFFFNDLLKEQDELVNKTLLESSSWNFIPRPQLPQKTCSDNFQTRLRRVCRGPLPYGKPLVLDQYGTVLLFATGIGITGQLPYMKELLTILIVNEIEYTKAESNPPMYESVMNLPRYYSTMRLDNMGTFASEGGGAQPKGLCLSEIKSVSGITWSIALEPLPPAIYAKGARANSLGLGGRTKPLVVVMLLTASFKHARDKQKVEEISRRLMSAVKEEAQRQDADDP
ncbi:hypothetical protein M426DRAFT_27187 [Hypoxylon sp. CI-4A]|nr:hypothetical protein M426DRAFT_27187 [Hypoxylon sp. CI-4A]